MSIVFPELAEAGCFTDFGAMLIGFLGLVLVVIVTIYLVNNGED
jgi:hypothetical protein